MTLSRFPIRFDPWYARLSSALLLRPADSYVDVDLALVAVRMGWAFRAIFPRTSIASAARLDSTPLSRGVHGFGGRWLVNGSGDRIVTLRLAPEARARVLGVPVRLRELSISVDDPDALVTTLSAPPPPA